MLWDGPRAPRYAPMKKQAQLCTAALQLGTAALHHSSAPQLGSTARHHSSAPQRSSAAQLCSAALHRSSAAQLCTAAPRHAAAPLCSLPLSHTHWTALHAPRRTHLCARAARAPSSSASAATTAPARWAPSTRARCSVGTPPTRRTTRCRPTSSPPATVSECVEHSSRVSR